MSLKRFLPLAAILGLGFGFIGPSVPSASAGLTYCWTVFRDTTIYTTASGSTSAGQAFSGDTFENINDIVSGIRRYGVDDETGVYGWIDDGDLTDGIPCG